MTLERLMIYATGAMLCMTVWACFCRINLMAAGVTRIRVILQYAGFGAGAFCGLILPREEGMFGVSAGMLLFLLLGARAWRDGAPLHTDKDHPLETSTKTQPAPLDAIPPKLLDKIKSRGRKP